MKIKKYKFEKVEIESRDIQLPTETSYFFETGIRRSIKIIPKFRENNNKEDDLFQLIIICIYQNFECRIEKFNIYVSDIEKIYYSENHIHKSFVTSLIENYFNIRTKEQFENDFNNVISEIKNI